MIEIRIIHFINNEKYKIIYYINTIYYILHIFKLFLKLYLI